MPVKAGAIEVIIVNLSKELVKRGHNVTILDRKYFKDDPDVEYTDGIRIVRLRAKRFACRFLLASVALSQLLFALRVKRYLSNLDNVDIIHTHVSIIGLTLAVLDRNLRGKHIYTSHTPRRVIDSPKLFDRLALFPENKLPKRIKKTIVLNEEIKGKLMLFAKAKPQDVVTVPFGIDTDRFNPNLDGHGVRQKYGLEGKDVILYVGIINERKGIEYLVKAANIVVNGFGYRNAFFLLVGPTEYFGLKEDVQTQYLATILSLIENYGLEQNIKLTGLVPQEKLGDFYAACDMFVLPSLAEATPAVVLEAMACGKPVVATRVGGIPMAVGDGQSGLLVDPADESQLAQRIKYLIDNPAEGKDMGAYGRKLIEKEFGSSKMAERLLQVYQAVMTSLQDREPNH